LNIPASANQIKLSRKKQFDLFVLVLVLLLIFILAARTPLDSDMWWHLRAGQETWQSGRPMLVDNLSTTRFGAHWINHSWLSEVGMYLLYMWGGSLAISGMTALLAVLSMTLVYFTLEGPALLRAFLLILGSAVAAVVWSPRPQLVSLVLMALVGYLLYLYKWKGVDRLWLLPVVFILWANLHGGFPLGFMLIGCMVAGEFLNYLLGNCGNHVLDRKRVLRLLIWGGISVAALLINANGLNILLIPFQTVGVRVLQNFVAEWASPDFHQLFQQPFIWLLLALLASVGFSGKRLDATDLLSVSLFTYLGLVARRNYGPFSLVAIPVLSRHLWPAIRAWYEREPVTGWKKSLGFSKSATGDTSDSLVQSDPIRVIRPGVQKAINLGLVAFVAFAAIGKLYVAANPILVDSSLKSTYPVKAIAWLRTNHPTGPMLNEYNWGGYLIWFLREYPVFVDGRTDLYGDDILGQWITVIQAGQGWQGILDKWKIRLILIEPGRPLAAALPQDGWKMLYQDDQALIFSR
jgi:hypothetical protein